MLKDSIAVLAATTPQLPSPKKFIRIGDAVARISELETQLGVPHGLPIFNIVKSARRVVHLETLLAQKNAAAPVVTAPPAMPAAKADDGILKTTLAEFRAMDAETRLQFAQDGGALAKSDFDRLTPAAKMAFVRNGGKLIAEETTNLFRSTAAASFGGK
jgi:hypothetical protein